MDVAIKSAVERIAGFPVVSTQPVAGGCINVACIVAVKSGQQFFVKSNAAAPAGMFETEAKGLRQLQSSNAIRVPKVFSCGSAGKTEFLILEAIQTGQTGKPAAEFFQQLGRALAQLHRTSQKQFGLSYNNFLGSTPQRNQQNAGWTSFWKQQRFGFQFGLAREKGYANANFNRLSERLLDRVDELLKTDEPPALIHGDLWSGNYMVGPDGEPVLVDPAVYFAAREAEFGMTTLFGGFDQSFYDAYNEAWPLSAGAQQRIELYRLYHLLNHLNLFGSSYLSDCIAIMKKYS